MVRDRFCLFVYLFTHSECVEILEKIPVLTESVGEKCKCCGRRVLLVETEAQKEVHTLAGFRLISASLTWIVFFSKRPEDKYTRLTSDM